MELLNNCGGYLLYTVPSSVMIFLAVSWVHSKISQYKVAALLMSFSSWGYLAVSLLGDNLQYLSFHSFQQLRAAPQPGLVALLSRVVALLVLFVTLVCALCLYYLSLRWANRSFRPSLLRKTRRAAGFLSFWLACRVLSGFMNAAVDEARLRMALVVALQAAVVVSYVASAPHARYKTSLACVVVGHVMRLALYVVALCELVWGSLVADPSNNLVMTDVSMAIIYGLFGANALQIVLHIVVGILVKKKVSVERSHTKTLPSKKKAHEAQ